MTTTFTTELIGPELAAGYLSTMEVNRQVSQKRVVRYAGDMARGDWQRTGEAIKFSTDGKLIDGQHRLWGIIEAGVTVEIDVARNIEASAQGVMDSGQIRTSGQHLQLQLGVRNSSNASALAKVAISYETGLIQHAVSQARGVSNSEIYNWVEKIDPDLLTQAINTAKAVRKHGGGSISGIGAAYLVLVKIDAEAAQEFFDRIIEMRTNGKGDPILALIRKLSSVRMEAGAGASAQSLTIFSLFRAWNAWRTGEEVQLIRHVMSGKPLPIPTPR